jgi:hypothetical protein
MGYMPACTDTCIKTFNRFTYGHTCIRKPPSPFHSFLFLTSRNILSELLLYGTIRYIFYMPARKGILGRISCSCMSCRVVSCVYSAIVDVILPDLYPSLSTVLVAGPAAASLYIRYVYIISIEVRFFQVME